MRTVNEFVIILYYFINNEHIDCDTVLWPFPNMFGHQSAGRDHTSCSSEEESEENLYVPTLLFARAQCLVDTVSPCDWLIQSLLFVFFISIKKTIGQKNTNIQQ